MSKEKRTATSQDAEGGETSAKGADSSGKGSKGSGKDSKSSVERSKASGKGATSSEKSTKASARGAARASGGSKAPKASQAAEAPETPKTAKAGKAARAAKARSSGGAGDGVKGASGRAEPPASRVESVESIESVIDSSDERAAEMIELYRDLAADLSEAADLGEAVSRTLEHFCRFASFAAGYGSVDPLADSRAEAWCTAEEGRFGALRDALGRWHERDGYLQPAGWDSPATTETAGTLVGRALESGLPVMLDEIEAEALEEAAVLLESGLRAAFAFPVFFGSEVVAVVAFFAEDPGPLSEPMAEAVQFALRQLEVVAGSERADRAVRVAARHARAQAAELNEMAVRLRDSGSQGGDGMYDALTGFPRRRLLLDRLQQALRRRQRNPDIQFAVACVGLEGLRQVRDRLGLRASEEFLLALCRRMESAVRPADTIARTAEDEFTILLEDSDGLKHANAAAERMQAAICRPYRLDDEEVNATASIGLALSNPAYEYAETILRDATAALRASRAFGDEHPRVFDMAEQPRSRSARPHEEDLAEALRDGEMALEYQPVVSLRSGRVAGFEARAKWMHPERGRLAPEQFLPESGAGPAVSALLTWSLRQAATQVIEWRRQRPGSPPYAALVLSSEQFYSPDLVTEAWDVLTNTDLEGDLLRLVVQESVLAQSPGQAAQVLASLGALEVGVVMEGFGTGYSTLPNLHRLRPRGLVIDRAFLVGASNRPTQWLVARTIVELARILEAEAIAAGIENGDQLTRLFQLGCQRAQGPYFGGGLDADKTRGLIEEGFGPEVKSLRRPAEGGVAESPFTRFLEQRN
jgi:diguanylate cyclase (GGDEF)-like protein